MDPSGPWSYTYNRIAVSGVSTAGAATPTSTGSSATVSVIGSTDYPHNQQNLTTISGQTASNTSPTSTIILQPISGNQGTTFNPYDQVLSPIFQHSGAKTVGNYNSTLNSHRQNLNAIQVTVNASDKTDNTRHNFTNHEQQSQQQQQHFYAEHNEGSPSASGTTLSWQGGTSQLNVTDPFTILSQEDASPGQSNSYTSQYPITQTHLGQIKVNTRSSTSTQVAGSKTTMHSSPSAINTVAVSSGIPNSTQYYRQPATITSYTDSSGHVGNISNSNKSISISNTSPLNQTCILVTTSAPIQGGGGPQQNSGNQKYIKKQNILGRSSGKTTIMSTSGNSGNIIANTVTNNGNNNYHLAGTTVKGANQSLQLVQTKAETKVYPELVFVDENDRAKLAEIHQADPQDGSISYYTIIDGRLVCASGNTNVIINEVPKGRTVTNIQSPRQFVLSNSSDIFPSDGNRMKPEQTYTMTSIPNEYTNAIIVPRKQSPSHSSSSQAASPAYPIYNSPMNSIESPSQHSATSTGTTHSSDNSGHIVIYKTNPQSQAQISTHSSGNLDVSVTSRNVANNSYTNTNSPVVYSSVITRALVNEQGKVYSTQPTTCWDNDVKSKKFYTINSGSPNEIVVPADIQFNSSGNATQIGALHGLKTDEQPITENIVVTTDNPLASQIQITKLDDQSATPQIIHHGGIHSSVQSHSVGQQSPVVHQVTAPKTRRKRNQNSTKTREQLLSENEFLVNRVPSQTHIAKIPTVVQETSPNITIQQVGVCQSLSQQENGGSYYDNKWNTHSNVTQATVVAESASIPTEITNYNSPQQIVQQQPQVLVSHPHDAHSAQTYYTNYPISAYIPGQVTSTQSTLEVPTPTSIEVQQQQPAVEVTSQIIAQNPMVKTIEDNVIMTEETLPKPEDKVVVPDIEEELKFLTSKSFEPIKVSKAPSSAYGTPVLKSTPQLDSTKPKTFKLPNSAATGFMSSYLKFLQGDPESSPPPLGRLQKKTLYQKTSSPATGNIVNSSPVVSKSTTGGNAISTIKSCDGTLLSTVLAANELDTAINSQQLQVVQSENSLIPIQSSSRLPLTTSSTATTTTTTSIASTQTINKKRKAVELYSDDNNQKRIVKTKSVAEIAVQTASHPVMLPKKARPQMAMQMASMQQNKMQNVIITTNSVPSSSSSNTVIPQSTIISPTIPVVTSVLKPPVRTVEQSPISQDTVATYRYQEMEEDDPLDVPPRRETSHRKAKTRGIREIMQKDFYHDDASEFLDSEFFDSDTDPVWTPEDNDKDSPKSGKGSKRKAKKSKTTYSRSRKICSNILTAAVMGAGINDSDADNNNPVGDGIKQREGAGKVEAGKKPINSPKGMKQEAIKAQAQNSSTTITDIVSTDFKNGDFVILRSDLVKDWPALWKVDGKLILQMFEAFNKEGKILYKSKSKYGAWNNISKKLYVRAPISLRSHNQNETLVELNKSQLYGTELEQYARKMMNDYLSYRENFEVYVQTLISQSLDQSFINVIAKEEDDYFLSNVKIIENIMEKCKRKLLLITELPDEIIVSIGTWSVFNTIIDLGHNDMNQMYCCGCAHPGVTSRFLLFGQPYNFTTMMPEESNPNIKYQTEMVFCQSCVTRAELLHKITHEKYNLYQICLRKVQDQQITNQAKGSTAILTDLLADSDWIDQLFLNVRASWTEVDVMERIVQFYRVSQ